MSDQIIKGKGIRIAFPHLVEKQSSAKYPNAKPKFGIQLLLHKKDNKTFIAQMDAAVDAICEEQGWAKNTVKALPYVESSIVVKEDGTPYAGYDDDHYSVSAKSDNRPLVVGKGGDILSSEEISSMIYGGCYCLASIAVYPAKAYRKICVELRAIGFDHDGDRFGGTAQITNAKSEFAGLIDDGSDLM